MDDRQYPAGRAARRSRGIILVAVIVCLMIVSALLVSTLATAAAASRATQYEGWRVQAEWLAQSGLQRAAARLRSDAGYQGETWRLAAAELGGNDAALVVITVAAAPEQPAGRQVRAVADYPDHPENRARHTAEITVEMK